MYRIIYAISFCLLIQPAFASDNTLDFTKPLAKALFVEKVVPKVDDIFTSFYYKIKGKKQLAMCDAIHLENLIKLLNDKSTLSIKPNGSGKALLIVSNIQQTVELIVKESK